jgi:hypothetical protein
MTTYLHLSYGLAGNDKNPLPTYEEIISHTKNRSKS